MILDNPLKGPRQEKSFSLAKKIIALFQGQNVDPGSRSSTAFDPSSPWTKHGNGFLGVRMNAVHLHSLPMSEFNWDRWVVRWAESFGDTGHRFDRL